MRVYIAGITAEDNVFARRATNFTISSTESFECRSATRQNAKREAECDFPLRDSSTLATPNRSLVGTS